MSTNLVSYILFESVFCFRMYRKLRTNQSQQVLVADQRKPDAIYAGGGHLYFRLDIIRVKGLSKRTLNMYFPGMKIDLKYAFLHAFFFNLYIMSFPKFVI